MMFVYRHQNPGQSPRPLATKESHDLYAVRSLHVFLETEGLSRRLSVQKTAKSEQASMVLSDLSDGWHLAMALTNEIKCCGSREAVNHHVLIREETCAGPSLSPLLY